MRLLRLIDDVVNGAHGRIYKSPGINIVQVRVVLRKTVKLYVQIRGGRRKGAVVKHSYGEESTVASDRLLCRRLGDKWTNETMLRDSAILFPVDAFFFFFSPGRLAACRAFTRRPGRRAPSFPYVNSSRPD